MLGRTNRVILAIGALAGAIVAIAAIVHFVLPGGRSDALAAEASFAEAKLDPDVLLEQYEAVNNPAALASAESGLGARAGEDRLAAYRAPPLAPVTESASTEAEISEQIAREARKEEEEQEKVKREDAETAANIKREEEAQKRKEEQEQAEEARIRKQRQEGAAPSTTGTGTATGTRTGGGQGESTGRERAKGAPAQPIKVPAFTPAFHREGDAEVAVGTGAPTSQVDAVLSEAIKLLEREESPFGTETVSFGAGDSSFREVSNAPPVRSASGVRLYVPSHCGTSCALRPVIDQAIANYSSNRALAAREIAAVFHDSRVEVFDGKLQPVGASVNYTVAVSGLADQLVRLEWTLYSKQSGQPLSREWWRNVIVKQIKPLSERVLVAGSFWAPVPPNPGDYYFQLRLLRGQSESAHRETEPFH